LYAKLGPIPRLAFRHVLFVRLGIIAPKHQLLQTFVKQGFTAPKEQAPAKFALKAIIVWLAHENQTSVKWELIQLPKLLFVRRAQLVTTAQWLQLLQFPAQQDTGAPQVDQFVLPAQRDMSALIRLLYLCSAVLAFTPLSHKLPALCAPLVVIAQLGPLCTRLAQAGTTAPNNHLSVLCVQQGRTAPPLPPLRLNV